MYRRIVILQGHPDPDQARLGRALADAYAYGAMSAGHDIRRIDIAALDIPFLRGQDEFENGTPPPPLAEAQEALAWAEHVVVFFPLWLGDMPARLKAFFEQVLRPGFAFAYRAKGFPEKRLAGRTGHVVITMGMPAFAYRWFYCGHSLRLLKRNILGFVGIAPVADTIYGSIAGASAEQRELWLEEMQALGARAG
ncbi:MAG: NAD(P)H-dependent oxidoreductase [Ferrovibrio sp.]|uniref:NAD(P)H-dependent oxidoreductase n=1 Tax=Ferrovibrio sp. TaxID=1917215 RepID=UPI00262889A7|nr:NAD(P)H-dependent oxidoreductase [Ferrovibrio sp.]MCW0233543.1 NAD(P)H-dependent oxidoreductase [Ferrovibrio sp.]